MALAETKISSKMLLEEMLLRSFTEMLQKRLRACKGNPNIFMREVQSLHGNMTKADLPDGMAYQFKELADAMLAFANSEGFVIVPKK